MSNKKAIKIIEKYDNKLSYLKNSEGWFKYTLAIEHLIKEDIPTTKEVEILNGYKEKKD